LWCDANVNGKINVPKKKRRSKKDLAGKSELSRNAEFETAENLYIGSDFQPLPFVSLFLRFLRMTLMH
jgi:hypothetical protein